MKLSSSSSTRHPKALLVPFTWAQALHLLSSGPKAAGCALLGEALRPSPSSDDLEPVARQAFRAWEQAADWSIGIFLLRLVRDLHARGKRLKGGVHYLEVVNGEVVALHFPSGRRKEVRA